MVPTLLILMMMTREAVEDYCKLFKEITLNIYCLPSLSAVTFNDTAVFGELRTGKRWYGLGSVAEALGAFNVVPGHC